MSDYFFSNGINDNGGNIVLTAPWEHQKSELRCLAIATNKEHQELKVLNGDLILGSNGTYTITYPFETLGLPWAAYLWRETTQNGNPKYENGRIPVEAMLSKLSELSKKADETREFVKRAFMTPEDAEGKMFVPPLEVRKGRLLGFDNSGNPVTGDACPQIAELDEQQKVIEGLAKDARDRALEAANSVIRAAEYATNASNSANNAGRSAVSAGNYATNAKNWHDKTVSESAAALAKSELASGRSELAERLARESAARAEQAMNEALLGLSDLSEKLCYVACAVVRAEKAVETVELRAEEAKTELTEKAEQTKQEIAGFTDVYKKSETYSKSEIDGFSTGAEVTLKMNEIIGYLKDYEEVTGEKLPFELWEAVMAEFQRWQENPTEVKEWVTTSATESTSPYFSTPASKPIVEFNVVSCVSNVSEYGVINIAHDVSAIFLPNVVNAQRMIRGISAEKVFVALPNATRLYGMAVRADAELVVYAPLATNVEAAIQRTTKNAKVIAPNATSASYFAQYASEFNNEVDFPKCTNWFAFASGASKYNQATNMESATKADAAFGATAMSPENIAATLDTLPTGKSDGSSKILFSRADGTKLTPLMAESPYKESVDAAVARGWTVQFDS